MNQAYASTKLASRPAYETLEQNTTRNALREEEDMADDDALFQKGMPIRREVLGPEYVDASMARGRIYDVVPTRDHRLGMGLGVG